MFNTRSCVRIAAQLGILSTASMLFSASAQAQTLSDPSATSQANAVYSYISNLENQPNNRVLSGQFVMPDGLGWATGYTELYWGLRDVTGKEPALIGADFTNIEGGSTIANSALLNRLAWHYKTNGNIITLSWHTPNPWNGKNQNNQYKDVAETIPLTSGSLKDLLPSGARRADWLALLDKAAVRLQSYEDQGVPVLWRPLHEMTGDWFWWGCNRDNDDYIALWRDMHDYFRVTKGLHNLIWVWSPSNRSYYTAPPYMNYYPGSSYVDIVGADVYNVPSIANAEMVDYSILNGLSKPIIYPEFGLKGDYATSYYNYYSLAEKVRTTYPNIVGWMSWNDYERSDEGVWNYQSIKKKDHGGVMYHPWVITRDELPFGGPSNLFANSSFDANASDTQTPSSWGEWVPATAPASAAAAFTTTTGGSHSGSRHGRHQYTGPYFVFTFQSKTGLTNGLYDVQAWVRKSGTATSYVTVKEYDGANVKRVAIPANSNYQLIRIPGIDVKTNKITVGVETTGNTGDTVDFDDIDLLKQVTPP